MRVYKYKVKGRITTSKWRKSTLIFFCVDWKSTLITIALNYGTLLIGSDLKTHCYYLCMGSTDMMEADPKLLPGKSKAR